MPLPHQKIYYGGKTAYVNGQKITGTYRTLKMSNIGDYVTYTPDKANNYTISSTYSGASTNQTITQEDLKWRIFNINEDGTVDLISAVPTTNKVVLSGALGYNNGVYFLNDVSSKLYSNKKLEATARSMNIEDIEAHFSGEGKKYVQSYKNDLGHSVGDVITYTNRYYPILYAQENGSGINTKNVKKDGVEKSDSYYTSPTTQTYVRASQSLTVTLTYYFREVNNELYYDNNIIKDIIHSGNYWLASRWINELLDTADFCIAGVLGSGLNGVPLYVSDNRERDDLGYKLRPIVTLKSNTLIESGDGSEQNPYILKY